MASTASTSFNGPRDEAGPLPRKVGELSFNSTASVPQSEGDITETASSEASSSTLNANAPSARATTTAGNATASTLTRSASSLPGKRLTLAQRIFSPKAPPLFWGFRGATLFKLLVILLLIGGLGASWGFGAQRLANAGRKSNAGKEQSESIAQMAGTMLVFVHVAFAIGLIVLVVFLERTVFVLRAERWLHTHPGETLPMHRGGTRLPGVASLSTAPWNRPPLPTYAAALGFQGTGDAEDDVIAPPPPPAYGNTRGSVLLLASAIRRISGGGTSAGPNHSSQLRSPRSPREFQQIPESRPVSYISTEGLHDIQRAQQLEMSLARLEGQSSSATADARRE